MRKLLVLLVVLALVAGGGTIVFEHHRSQQRAREAAQARAVTERFLAAWQAKRYGEMGPLTAADPDAGDSFRLLAARLRATAVTVTPGATSADGRTRRFHVVAQLAGLGPLAWDDSVGTVRTGAGMRVDFRSSTVYPGLRNGQLLTRSEPKTSRGALVDRRGRPLREASADLAANVLGRATPPQSGLERLYDSRLSGSSGGDVQIVDRAGGPAVVVKAFPPKPAAAVRTTLDLDVQRAAEAALTGVAGQAAVVVVDAASGEIRAVADRPVAGLPAAFRDEAPGSTFKVVVAAAALLRGTRLSTPLACPASTVKGGKRFVNDELLPPVLTLASAFARSCNTAFLDLAASFPKGTLGSLAPTFGFDRGDLLPTGAQGGTIPEPGSTAEAFADVIGQGRVEASPLLLASMSAAVASGTWHRPHLVTGPSDATPLPARIVPALQQLMAGVVTSGTAARAGLPAGTHGKTGTAQYGTALPLRSHAWFTGYRGDLAFCVYVKDGVSGGATAAPVAARLLRAIA